MSLVKLLLLMSLALVMRAGAAVEIQRPRGVPLSKRQFYEEEKPFTCLDGSRTIPFDRVNDDYCDCKDGSDEPGTAACPNGSFHCTNAGFRPAFIPSSRINDGICDCCDTTDEYNSGATCQNTCRELGRKERESLQKMAEVTREGFMLKQQLIHEAKKGQEEKQVKLTEFQSTKKGLEEKVEALRTVKEIAEEPEKEAKDVSVAELQSHPELDPDSDGSLTETETQVGGLPCYLPLLVSRYSCGLFFFKCMVSYSTDTGIKEIGFDFGPSAEFAYLYSQCYELSTSEYVYRLCPFNRVSQKPKFGGSETNLGLWGQWAGPEDNIYAVMKYDHGTGCWQGPNRSTTVKLTCGKETVVTSTSEPSRCEYLMEFTTPAVCQEPPSLEEALHGHTEL
uniref:Glucosidase 2 subunit beta n=1 Tax=Esox lucius TaxID=8010 RepID=A0A3P8Z6H4_ESOLU